jgi:predicted nucleic acid-binding protein
MKVLVPDASIILKWVLDDERDQDKARKILSDWLNQEHEFILPSLWVYEVGNVLGLKRPKDSEKILGLLLEYEFQECLVTKDLIHGAFSLMNAYRGITFYDAIYHALALQENGVMITADKAYFEKTKSRGSVQFI